MSLRVIAAALLLAACVVPGAAPQAEAPPPPPARWQEWGSYHTRDGVTVYAICDYERKDMIYTASRAFTDAGVGIFVVPGGCK